MCYIIQHDAGGACCCFPSLFVTLVVEASSEEWVENMGARYRKAAENSFVSV